MYETSDIEDGYEWQEIPAGFAMPTGYMYRMDMGEEKSYVAWPVDMRVPWAEEHAEDFTPDWTNESSASHMEADGSGAHPAAKQEVKEEDAKQEVKVEDAKSEDGDFPWWLFEAETQPDDIVKTHTRALPLPAAAIFVIEEHGERHDVDVIYAGHGMSKMVYKVEMPSISSCLFPGRVLKLTPRHDPEPDMIAQLPAEVAPQVHVVKKLFFTANQGGEWHKSNAEEITWHAWITDWMMPCDHAVNKNKAPFVAVVQHFASFKRLCTYIHMELYEYIHSVTMLSVICKLYHVHLRY